MSYYPQTYSITTAISSPLQISVVLSHSTQVTMSSGTRWFQLATGESPPASLGFCIMLKPGLTPNVTFAAPTAITRQCRLFSTVLDDLDLLPDSSLLDNSEFPEITLPGFSAATCVSALKYLELTVTRIPSMISRPLRSPLAEVTQPWELEFIAGECRTQDQLLHLMLLADYLLVDALRDLLCAHLASIVIQCDSEQALMQVLGIDRAYGDEELQAVYTQFPFLAPEST
jgi:hypothetical protein